jgi:hypothetical protein
MNGWVHVVVYHSAVESLGVKQTTKRSFKSKSLHRQDKKPINNRIQVIQNFVRIQRIDLSDMWKTTKRDTICLFFSMIGQCVVSFVQG